MTWWRKDGREIIGWEPTDSADGYTPELDGKTSRNPVVERYQGGGYCGMDYSRETPAPVEQF